MAFNSVEYFALLLTVLLLYWALRRLPEPYGTRSRIGLLLFTSYLFYAAWDWRFLSLLWLSTIVDFTVARQLQATEDARRRRIFLLVSLTANLGMLAVFKYADFFIDSFARLLTSAGMDPHVQVLNLLLPVGISFYTFQTMAYTIDVYMRRTDASDDLLVFATYVAFFPQLVAGPIERPGRLVPQLAHPPTSVSQEDVTSGVGLILLGLFKKVVLADAVAPFVQAVFSDPDSHSSVAVLVGVYAFAIQIYGDFSGYSDIARGSARLLGIRLVRNFEQPYLSRNIVEFWRTWHMSLSEWLRDYLYIPLGGNRRGVRRTTINLFLTMLLGGLWHGPAWTFVIWGALHGTYLILHRVVVSTSNASRPSLVMPGVRDWWRILLTFHAVCLGWILFRAENLTAAVSIIRRIASFDLRGVDDDPALVVVLAAAAMMVAIDLAQRSTGQHVPFLGRPLLRGALAGVALTGILLYAGQAAVPFLYFQF